MIGKLTKMLTDQREEILKAFIAKYGCEPDEIEQVMQQEDMKIIFYVRKKTTEWPKKEKAIDLAHEHTCTCGGAGPGEGCPACEMWHFLTDWRTLNADRRKNTKTV